MLVQYCFMLWFWQVCIICMMHSILLDLMMKIFSSLNLSWISSSDNFLHRSRILLIYNVVLGMMQMMADNIVTCYMTTACLYNVFIQRVYTNALSVKPHICTCSINESIFALHANGVSRPCPKSNTFIQHPVSA